MSSAPPENSWRSILSLEDDRWRFGPVPRRPFTAVNVYDLPDVIDWNPATVPGHVRTDLLALGCIPDPFVGEQYRASQWVETCDWWYRRPLTIEPPGPTERIFVRFSGLDYLSAVFVDDQELLRHEGMFSPVIIDLTEQLSRNGGRAELAVRLWGSDALPRRRLSLGQRLWQKIGGALHGSWVGVYPDRSATLKCQMSFGWDFAPPIRTMGLWDQVDLIRTGPVAILEAGALGEPQAIRREGGRAWASPATLTVRLGLNSLTPGPVELTVRLDPANFQGDSLGPFPHRLDLPAGFSRHQLQVDLPQAALWQPWDQGQPHLYRLRLTLRRPDGTPLDQVEWRTGVRAVRREGWRFWVNGQPQFMRGLNWVPADSFPGRLRQADYARLLALARQSGANLLRVWGGGLREKRAFYDLCDELGLLVWQEFPFACMFLGSFPRDEAYLAKVLAECGAIVRQLYSHPALILWCGGNEFSRRRNRPLVETLAGVVAADDGRRPFVPTSPGYGPARDAHNWTVWHGQAPLRAYQAETAAFLSEFGLQALPAGESLAAALPNPADPAAWATHQADPAKLARYVELFLPSHLEPRPAASLSPKALDAYIAASQQAQLTALQTAIEHQRRRKGEAGGVCLWQFNEPWPAISWAVLDYFGRPKLAYRWLQHGYHPLLISLAFPVGRRWQPGDRFEAGLWAINDYPHPVTGCRLEIQLDGRLLHTQPLDLPPASARLVGRLSHRFTAPPGQLRLTLHQEGTLIAQNYYLLHWADSGSAPLLSRLRRWVADWVMR